MAKSAKRKIYRLPMTRARIKLGEVVRRAHIDKHYFILEKDGIPLVGIMDIDEFEDYLETRAEQEDPELQKQIRAGFKAYKLGRIKTSEEFFASLKSKKQS